MSIKDEIEKMRNGRPLKDIPDWADTPAEALINTTLVIFNTDKAAQDRYKRFREKYPYVKSVNDLAELLSRYNEKDFCWKYLHIDVKVPNLPRYIRLVDMVKVFQKKDIQEWADNFDPFDRKKCKNDPVFQIRNVGLATIQNLRICLKIPTLKPDGRVINALEKLGYHNTNGFKIMNICQSISDETGYPLYHLDQIFWKANVKKYENQKMGEFNGWTKE